MWSLVALATVALLCVVVDGQITEIKEDDALDCFNYINCDIRKTSEFRKALNRYKPKGMERLMSVYRELAQSPDADNNDDTWTTFSDTYCPYSDDGKESFFSHIGSEMTDYWAKVCDEDAGDQEECEGMGIAVSDFFQVIGKYLAMGVCGSVAKEKGAMKLPGFG